MASFTTNNVSDLKDLVPGFDFEEEFNYFLAKYKELVIKIEEKHRRYHDHHRDNDPDDECCGDMTDISQCADKMLFATLRITDALTNTTVDIVHAVGRARRQFEPAAPPYEPGQQQEQGQQDDRGSVRSSPM